MPFAHKVQVRYVDVASGNVYLLPAVYTESGVIASHLRYLAWFSYKSESWKERSVFSLRLLISYINSLSGKIIAIDLLKSFTRSLVTGTIDYESCNDPMGLFWPPRSTFDVNNILFHITHYTDYLARQPEYETARINPFVKATGYEERLNWCAYYNRNANVFLNHLKKRADAYLEVGRTRAVAGYRDPKIDNDKVVKFPDDMVYVLLQEGFSNSEGVNYKYQLMTMLMNYGGLRKSELFHLYVSDITVHPERRDEALVRVYHPEYGKSPLPDYKNRREYLLAETQYKPRNSYPLSERLHAGWKGALLTSRAGFFEVIFNPPGIAKTFLSVWVKYLKYQRVEPAASFHPFAFTKKDGGPETLKNFQRAHKRAVEKIGLVCKKEFGTTEHGHRHAYGYRARKFGLSRVEIQKSMHHRSPDSCLVYIKPTNEDIRERMRGVADEDA